MKELVQYWRLYLLMSVLGIGGSFQYGIQVSIMASPAQHIQGFVNQTWLGRYGVPVEDSTNMLIWSFIVSVFSLGGWVGAVHSGSLPAVHGRKKALLFNSVVSVVAALVMVFSPMAKSFEMILLGRFLYGYNAGLGLSASLMYLGESSPMRMRGFMSLSCSIFLGLGKIIGQILGIRELLGTNDMWPVLLAICGLPAVIQLLALPFFPESPRYLYIDKCDTEGCKTALQWLWQEDDLKLELEDMDKERESSQGQKTKTVLDVLRSRCVRWQLLALVFPCAGVQFCGINALYFYSFDIFREAGVAEDKMQYLSIGIGATELVTVSFCSLLIDRAGRKTLMGYGYLFMGVIMSVLIVLLYFKDLYVWMPYLNITLIFAVICVYGLGPCGVSMALPADLFLQAWRPSAYVISGTVNWLGLFLISMCFPYIVDGMGEFCFVIFVVYCIFSSAFMLYFIPETRKKTAMEIVEDFNKLNFKNRTSDTEKNHFGLVTKF